ncbi:DUF655 domain-containing protein [Phormidium sp. LEGE 05292]|uniref:DUF655 domain-containing protein n=1 Tax=[Phormidium] sp. LEGE 05292 TaxID=767427 RepID=UPI0018818E8B|nr:DUF655 domain-containing protein [Phormidium sp. LEGE 05292]MBE9226725.1 DUF655 domain-containing protein [Phormidium sp. LEGE 05292]
MLHLPTRNLPKLFPAIVLAFFLSACQKAVPQTQKLTPLPQDPFVQVYFNHAQLPEYVESYRPQRRSGDDLEQVIVNTIANAKSTVDVAVQELRLPKIAQALVARQKAGVKVRVILENNYSRPWSKFTADEIAKLPPREQDRYKEYRKLVDLNEDEKLDVGEINQRDALVILENAKVPIIDDTADGSAGSGLMHHKFVIVDNQTLIITSANFTTSDIHGDLQNLDSLGNENNLLKINSPTLATVFTEEFNLMWGDGVGGKPDSKFGVKKPLRPAQTVDLGTVKISVQFSPTSNTVPWEQSSNGLIGKTLVTATESIDLALFVFSEQQLANILETDRQRGVKIKALIEPDFAYRYYSEGLDMMGVALVNDCKYEINNRPWQNPINTVGTPLLRKGDLLHHKFAVIDGKITIAGSHNWSDAANSNNDETLVIIQSPKVAAHFQREFDRLYADAQIGLPDRIKQKIKTQQQQCPQIETASKPVQQNSNSPTVPETQNLPKVNLNTATQQELEALPGIGPKLAQEIIKARQQKPFTSLEDLDRIPGIGPRLLEKLKDRVTW